MERGNVGVGGFARVPAGGSIYLACVCDGEVERFAGTDWDSSKVEILGYGDAGVADAEGAWERVAAITGVYEGVIGARVYVGVDEHAAAITAVEAAASAPSSEVRDDDPRGVDKDSAPTAAAAA